MLRILSAAILLALSPTSSAEVKAGEALDYSKLAFYPKRWEEKKVDTVMFPWVGENVAFLTMTDSYDPKVMTPFVGSLDKAWATYLKLTGKAPHQYGNVDGKAPIAAIPDGNLSCGAGCGYVGATGIEACYFYSSTYQKLQKNPKAIPHLYFYEMGRNFFTFGSKHNSFTTGFAVFMRYVCTDTLDVIDTDTHTRKVITTAIDDYAASDLGFLNTFTTAYGLSEKKSRLKTSPSDQPVMYASAMLKLWKTHGDDWLSTFYKNIHTLPGYNSNSKEGARAQSLGWYLAASVAAQKDLAPTFVKKWRLPLTDSEKKALAKVDWKADGLTAGTVIKKLPAETP